MRVILTESELAQIEEADEIGIRVEMVSGHPFREFQPNYRHQSQIFRIQSSTGCKCVHASDVGIRFPDTIRLQKTSTTFEQKDYNGFKTGRTVRLECGLLVDV